MTQPRFVKPVSLYVEARGLMSDGTEGVVKIRLDATEDSELSLDMQSLFDDDGFLSQPYVYSRPDGRHNFTARITKARPGEPVAPSV